MKLQQVVPYQVCVNLRQREDRRRSAWRRFAAADLHVDRQPGIPKEWVRNTWGFINPSRYACSLAKRLAIRRAKLAGAPAVLLFEDDVVLATDLHERLAEIELPEDWGIFFLGCKHLARPVPVAPGLVRVSRASDHHAMAIRSEYFNEAIRALAGHGKGSPPVIRYSDVKMSAIQTRVPTYAAFPNLAWQEVSFSNNSGVTQSHYDRQGRQLTDLYGVEGLELKMAELRTGLDRKVEGSGISVAIANDAGPDTLLAPELPEPPYQDSDVATEPPDFGFLDGAPAKHRIEATFPLRVFINLGPREDRRAEMEYQFALQDLIVERFAAVNGQWLTRTHLLGMANSYAAHLTHRMAIRRAKLRGSPAVLIFEDDAVLHQDFRRLLEALEPPKDWGVLLFSRNHLPSPAEEVAPGWVRATQASSLHAYAVSEKWYDAVLKALRTEGSPDNKLSANTVLPLLRSEIPIYRTSLSIVE